MLNNNYIVIIPAYNEQSTIIDCLNHVVRASLSTQGYDLQKIIVCINGCTDNTKALVKSWSGAPVEIIESRPGYINAMNKLFRYAKKHYPKAIMVKTDADGRVDQKAFSYLFKQLELHKELVVAGGHPNPVKSSSKNPYRQFMSSLVSVRSRTPEAEVTVTDSTRFHQYAQSDPIPELKGRENKLKMYFHGRLWCARTADYIPLLPREVIGDDVYLPGWLINTYGPRSMRLDYRAKVYFHPNDSLRRHWKVYRRIHEDRRIVYNLSGFDDYAEACALKLDWKYIINTCSLSEIAYFSMYTALANLEKYFYKFSTYSSTYWQYSKKEI